MISDKDQEKAMAALEEIRTTGVVTDKTRFVLEFTEYAIENWTHWIDASEKLPDDENFYLCSGLIPYNGRAIRCKRILKRISDTDYWDTEEPVIITHWMPIPETPYVYLNL